MHTRILALAALGGLIALPACTSNQAAVQPPFTPTTLTTSKLQFQVGTATYGANVFLNTVVTFRQPNGLSALLDDTPNITLPFTNTAPASAGGVIYAGNDSGKNQITGTVQTNNGATSTDPRTFPQTVGAFSYGFLASNSVTTGANNSVFYPATSGSIEGNRSPYYGGVAGVTQRAFYVGPGNPFVPNFKDGSLGFTTYDGTTGSFPGYPSGFMTFALTPTTGTYTLSVGLPNASTPVPTFTATTSLSSTAALPPMPAPVYTSDGAGGGTFAITVPPGVTETAIFAREISGTTGGVLSYYTVLTHGTGPQTVTLADNLGVISGGVAGPTIRPGNFVSAVAVGFDYPAMEAVPVGSSVPQAPVINNSGNACAFSGTSSTCPGQADVTVSGASATTPE
ncbi:MAG TPA: hypothetical protein VHT05_11060 [Candidatus Elarobacter sp.]|nr:hypothetical protein [Candidatus Elarobacter sp.]